MLRMESTMVIKPILKIMSVVFVLLLFVPSAQAQGGGASLSVGSSSGMAGDAGINIPVSIHSDDGIGVTGLNFDLTFDASRLTVQNINIGSSASSAGKTLSWSSPSTGRIRVIIFGLNQTSISNGGVANVTFSVNSGAASGSSSLSLGSATATDQNGNSVPLSLSSGTFTVNAPPPAPTSTFTSAPPSPTATATTQPKTIPTNTPTVTNTTQPTPTRTSTYTLQPSNTSAPTSTNSVAATATRSATATRTATPTRTIVSGSTATNSIALGSATPTEGNSQNTNHPPTATLDTSAIGNLTPTDDLSTKIPLLAFDDPIEAAVAATSTALAVEDQANLNVGPPSSAIEEDQDSQSTLVLGLQKTSGNLADNTGLLTALIVGTGVIGMLLLTPVTLHFLRTRGQRINSSNSSSSARSGSKPKDDTPLWRR